MQKQKHIGRERKTRQQNCREKRRTCIDSDEKKMRSAENCEWRDLRTLAFIRADQIGARDRWMDGKNGCKTLPKPLSYTSLQGQIRYFAYKYTNMSYDMYVCDIHAIHMYGRQKFFKTESENIFFFAGSCMEEKGWRRTRLARRIERRREKRVPKR